MSARLDHLVVLADTLAQGVAWCEATLGVVPAPGGQHPLFGTHNRLLAIGTPQHRLAYLELIAIDPQAADPGRTRWFDMDDERLRRQVRAQGPQLIHWVARVPELARAAAAWAALGLERGAVLPASRMTPRGLLEWQITVRDDGQRLLDGCLPTLIQWGAVHPADALPASGIALESLSLRHPQAALLRAALDAVGLAGIAVDSGPAALQERATLQGQNVGVALTLAWHTDHRTGRRIQLPFLLIRPLEVSHSVRAELVEALQQAQGERSKLHGAGSIG